MHEAGIWVNYSDRDKQMATFEVVHEGTEEIIQSKKVQFKKTREEAQAWENYGMFHDSNTNPRGQGRKLELQTKTMIKFFSVMRGT